MKKYHGILFILFPGWIFCQPAPRQIYEVKEDSLSLNLELVYNQSGYPDYYRGDIFTPVCKSGECLPVSIIIHWDLLGNYRHYEMPVGEILTKNDHAAFTEEDYQKLHVILHNSSSLLRDFDLSLLYYSLNESVESIDGITGATPKEINQSIVVGAFFTCHTLWHIVHGEVTGVIRESTHGLENPTLLHYLLSHETFDYRHYAIDRITGNSGNKEWAEILCDKIGEGNVFIDRHILQALPVSWLEDSVVQQKAWGHYYNISHENRILLVNRYKKIRVVNDIAKLLPVFAEEEN
ncbi:MAG: hypothetical protein OEY51_06560, partial [Cyclobacteriaceae bacterium]|nr:hypothetical protein [Cyclobacteriaceae bacterium]